MRGNVLLDKLQLVLCRDVADNQLHAWRRVYYFDRTAADDRVYVLDTEEALIDFGDGKRGRVPALGARIVAMRYRWTDGASSELAVGRRHAGRLPGASFRTSRRGPRPRRPQRGDPRRSQTASPARAQDVRVAANATISKLFATPDALMRRIALAEVVPLLIGRTARRASTGSGIDIARYRDPVRSRLWSSPMGWPDPTHRGRAARRVPAPRQVPPVTTELYVVAPQYVRVFDVVMTVVAKPEYTRTRLRELIVARLEQYSPMSSTAVPSTGFGFCVTLHQGELVAEAFRVDGVDCVEAAVRPGPRYAPRPRLRWCGATNDRSRATSSGALTDPLDDDRVALFPDETVFIDRLVDVIPSSSHDVDLSDGALHPGRDANDAWCIVVRRPEDRHASRRRTLPGSTRRDGPELSPHPLATGAAAASVTTGDEPDT